MLSPIIEKERVPPVLAYVALISRRHLPAEDVVPVEQIELLMAHDSVQQKLVIDCRPPTNA